jgi:hypothetical protein
MASSKHHRGRDMNHDAGFDVSLEASSVCVIDARGKIVREAKVASEPVALIGWFGSLGLELTRIGLEAGPLQWLYAGMRQVVLVVGLLETRHVRNAFKIGEDGSPPGRWITPDRNAGRGFKSRSPEIGRPILFKPHQAAASRRLRWLPLAARNVGRYECAPCDPWRISRIRALADRRTDRRVAGARKGKGRQVRSAACAYAAPTPRGLALLAS